ncbi:YwiC-like family protein, partial [Anaeromyxobacter terrae]|uniref:YwiC-like family protein n=1 Tax=Anaeromyxobacter terrae TaxID=2925406 RepID=UPI001F567BC4
MTSTATVQRPPARPAAQPRSMLPHEHGAWGQLAMPLLTALAIGRPGLAPSALTAAVVLAFVAHEPLLVLLGQRGRRVAEEEGPRARRWLAATGGLAAVTGAVGIALAPAAAR